MKTILTAGAAALFATLSLAASTVPASAGGGFSIGFGGYGPFGGPWYGGPHGGIYVDVAPAPVYGSKWQAHVHWCLSHYKSYDPSTNLYFTKKGPKHCNSPYF